jgi:hypothetical protein
LHTAAASASVHGSESQRLHKYSDAADCYDSGSLLLAAGQVAVYPLAAQADPRPAMSAGTGATTQHSTWVKRRFLMSSAQQSISGWQVDNVVTLLAGVVAG